MKMIEVNIQENITSTKVLVLKIYYWNYSFTVLYQNTFLK